MNFLTQSIALLLKPIVEIHPQERLKTFLMFSYFFLTIAMIYILKPVRNALFLGELGAQNLRYVYMGEGIFLIFVVWAYVQFAKRVSKKGLYTGVLIFFILCLGSFWVFFHTRTPYLSAFFYIWVASFSITMTTQFWILANDIFNPMEAKRLFGFMISGGSLGGILGGVLTHQAVRWLKTEDLLFVAAGILGLCILLLSGLWKEIPNVGERAASPLPDRVKESRASTVDETSSSAGKLFLGSSYLVMLACLVVFAKMASTIVDNQFNKVVELSIAGTEARTAYFGGFMAWLNAVSFLMQLFATSLALRYLGVGISLWILPAGLTFASFPSFLNPILLTAAPLKIFDGSVNYSIQQASKEVLYLPISSAVRYRVKPIIDMLGFRFAKTLAGLYIAVAAPLLALSDEKLSVLALCLIPFWGILVWRMKKGYSKLLRSNLRDRYQYEKATTVHRASDVLSFLYDEKTFAEIKTLMNHRSSFARKAAAAAYHAYSRGGKDLEAVRRLVEPVIRHEMSDKLHGHASLSETEQQNRDIRYFEDLLFLGAEKKIQKGESVTSYLRHYPKEAIVNLGQILADSRKGLDVKRRAVKILEWIPRQETVDLILSRLGNIQDHALRFVMIKALNRLHDQVPKPGMNRLLIKNEIVREVGIHEKIQKLRFFYEHQKEKSAEEYLAVTLKAVQDESLERIFRLLDLLYPHEIIEIIYHRIADHADEDPLRPHAIELLTNTLEPDLLILVQPVLEERAFGRLKDKEIMEILKSFMDSEDKWFSLIGHFLIAELRLKERWPEFAQRVEPSEFPFFQVKR
jgi:AAA family ATP:ADP antiporter